MDSPQTTAETCEILGSRISVLDCSETVMALRSFIDDGRKTYVCVTNVHTTVEGWKDPAFQAVTNGAALATADGVPLLWASKALKPAIHGRSSGPDILHLFLDADHGRRHRHFFFGSTPETLSKMVTNIGKLWPGTQIAGSFSPPFAPPSAETDRKHADLINKSGADIVWVGLGAPKQELWMARLRPFLEPAVLVGVGAAFDFFAGTKPRAPIWMQKAGLEWLFRLGSEPRRLFKRYAVTNTLFLAAATAQILRVKASGPRQPGSRR